MTLKVPMRVIKASLIPIIFAISVFEFPRAIAQFGRWEWLQRFAGMILPGGHWVGTLLYIALITGFTYFYMAATLRSHVQ